MYLEVTWHIVAKFGKSGRQEDAKTVDFSQYYRIACHCVWKKFVKSNFPHFQSLPPKFRLAYLRRWDNFHILPPKLWNWLHWCGNARTTIQYNYTISSVGIWFWRNLYKSVITDKHDSAIRCLGPGSVPRTVIPETRRTEPKVDNWVQLTYFWSFTNLIVIELVFYLEYSIDLTGRSSGPVGGGGSYGRGDLIYPNFQLSLQILATLFWKYRN